MHSALPPHLFLTVYGNQLCVIYCDKWMQFVCKQILVCPTASPGVPFQMPAGATKVWRCKLKSDRPEVGCLRVWFSSILLGLHEGLLIVYEWLSYFEITLHLAAHSEQIWFFSFLSFLYCGCSLSRPVFTMEREEIRGLLQTFMWDQSLSSLYGN